MKLGKRRFGWSLIPLMVLMFTASVFGNPVKNQLKDSPVEMDSPDKMDYPGKMDSSDKMDSPDEMDSPDKMDSPDEMDSLEDMDSSKEIGSSDEEDLPDECSFISGPPTNFAEDTCKYIGNIEDYVELVMSTPPVGRYYEKYPGLKSFDEDLENATEHALLWDTGDSIRSNLRRTFLLTRNFDPEFTRRYAINQERVEAMKNNTIGFEQITKAKNKIDQLQKAIADLENGLLEAMRINNTFFYTLLKSDIDLKTKEIKELVDFLDGKANLSRMMKGLISFLKLVKEDSDRIKTQAKLTREKLETFKTGLTKDKGKFLNHEKNANNSLERLIAGNEFNKGQLEQYRYNITELETQIELKHEQIKDVYNNIIEERRKLGRKEEERSNDKYHRSNKIHEESDFWSDLFRPSHRTRQLETIDSNFQELINSDRATYKDVVETLQESIQTDKERMAEFRAEGNKFMKLSKALGQEMNLFVFIEADLRHMAGESNGLFESVNKALHGVDIIHRIFEDVSVQLDEMIRFASRAKNATEKRDIDFWINERLSKLKCHWTVIKDKVIDIDGCYKELTIFTTPTTVEPPTNETLLTTAEPQTYEIFPTVEGSKLDLEGSRLDILRVPLRK